MHVTLPAYFFGWGYGGWDCVIVYVLYCVIVGAGGRLTTRPWPGGVGGFSGVGGWGACWGVVLCTPMHLLGMGALHLQHRLDLCVQGTWMARPMLSMVGAEGQLHTLQPWRAGGGKGNVAAPSS